jgi:hypothetical protein
MVRMQIQVARALALPGRRSHRRPGAEWARSRTERARSRPGRGPSTGGCGLIRRSATTSARYMCGLPDHSSTTVKAAEGSQTGVQRPGRWTDDADTHGWTSKPRALGAYSRNHEPTRRQGQDRWSLHIAGLNNTGYAPRLHQMGQAGRPGLEQVEGRDFCGPSLHGPGPRCAVMGMCRFGRSRP